MALSADRQFSKGRVALGGAIADQFDKFAVDSSPRYHVGFKVEEADGSVYRYAHFGAAVNRGILVAQDISESSVDDADNVIVAPASAVTTTDGTVGSRFVEITLASVSAGDYAGGKLVITDDTGEGYTYDIKGNTATGDPASGNIRVELYQPIQVAVDATSDFAISANPYHNLEGATAATDFIVSGVACSTMAADEWGWVQTKGSVGILQDGTIAAGDQVSLSDGVTGAVQVLGGGGTAAADILAEMYIGTCQIAGDTGGHGVFKIDVE